MVTHTRFVTDFASERWFVVVLDAAMDSEVSSLGKDCRAQLAVERPLSSVYQIMGLQLEPTREPLRAQRTLVVLVMDFHVCPSLRGISEGSHANGASLCRFFSIHSVRGSSFIECKICLRFNTC